MMSKTVRFKPIFILFFLLVSYAGLAKNTNFISCGIDDIDQIRKEVKSQPTTPDNVIIRRAALYRWWRLLWHQGYDMDAFDEVAEMLLNLPNSKPAGLQSITLGFMKLEEMMVAGKKIPEVRGPESTNVSTTTNWPLYHGTDATQSGYSPDIGPSIGNILWKFPKSYGCDISPLIDSGRVYLPGIGDDVIAYCLDEISGKVIWKGHKYGAEYYHNISWNNKAMLTANRMLVKTGAGLKLFEKTSGKLISKNEISLDSNRRESIHPKILKSGLNNFSCINAQTGKTIRNFSSPKKILGQPVFFNNYVFYITYDGTQHAISLNEENKKWQKNFQKTLDGSLSVNENSTLYLGTNEGDLLAVSSDNGDLKWTFNTEHIEPRSQQLFSEVQVADDRLYFGSANKMVYCLNAKNGSLNWKHQVDDWVRSKPYFMDEHLYVATLSGKMYAIKDNLNSAKLVWQAQVAEHGFTSSINGSRNGILGISQNQMVYSVSPKTGKIQWKHGLLDGMFIDNNFYSSEELGGQQSSPVVVDGVLYIGGSDGFVNAIDVKSGKEKWRFETDGIMASSPTVAFGKVFFGEAYNAKGTYYALDKETGKPVWKNEAFGNVWVNATFDEKNIYFGNMKGYLYAVNPQNGKIIWQYNTAKNTPLEHLSLNESHGHGFPPGVYCNPVFKNGIVYSGSWSGYYFAFAADDGTLKWRCKTKADGSDGGLPDSSAPVLYKNHLYVQKEGWKLAAINLKTGLID